MLLTTNRTPSTRLELEKAMRETRPARFTTRNEVVAGDVRAREGVRVKSEPQTYLGTMANS